MKKLNEQQKQNGFLEDENTNNLPETEKMRAARELRERRKGNKGKSKTASAKSSKVPQAKVPTPVERYAPSLPSSLMDFEEKSANIWQQPLPSAAEKMEKLLSSKTQSSKQLSQIDRIQQKLEAGRKPGAYGLFTNAEHPPYHHVGTREAPHPSNPFIYSGQSTSSEETSNYFNKPHSGYGMRAAPERPNYHMPSRSSRGDEIEGSLNPNSSNMKFLQELNRGKAPVPEFIPRENRPRPPAAPTQPMHPHHQPGPAGDYEHPDSSYMGQYYGNEYYHSSMRPRTPQQSGYPPYMYQGPSTPEYGGEYDPNDSYMSQPEYEMHNQRSHGHGHYYPGEPMYSPRTGGISRNPPGHTPQPYGQMYPGHSHSTYGAPAGPHGSYPNRSPSGGPVPERPNYHSGGSQGMEPATTNNSKFLQELNRDKENNKIPEFKVFVPRGDRPTSMSSNKYDPAVAEYKRNLLLKQKKDADMKLQELENKKREYMQQSYSHDGSMF